MNARFCGSVRFPRKADIPNERTADAFNLRSNWRKTMNDHEDDVGTGIDEDRTEGSLKQSGGKLKEGAGKLFGDEKMKREGQADQGKGKLQNAWGSIKDEARETFGTHKAGTDND